MISFRKKICAACALSIVLRDVLQDVLWSLIYEDRRRFSWLLQWRLSNASRLEDFRVWIERQENREGERETIESWAILEGACSLKKACEALEEQRKDDVTRNEIECIFISTTTNRPGHIIYLALSFRTNSNFHCFLVYKISSQLYSAMTAIDMSCINFYEPPPVRSSCFSLKSLMNKSFKTNRKIDPSLQSQMAEGDTKAMNEGIVETQRHEKLDDDRDTNNVKDLCFPFIEDFESLCDLSFETEKNTFHSLKNLNQGLSDDEFLDIDDVLDLVSVWTAEQPHFKDDVAQSSMKQSSSLRMSNSMLSVDEEFIVAMITTKILNSFKRKTDTVDLHVDDRVRILNKTIFTSTSTCLMILQNAHLKFSMTSMIMISLHWRRIKNRRKRL